MEKYQVMPNLTEEEYAQLREDPTYQGMIDLGNKAGVPVIACRYSDDLSTWKVVPLNEEAKKHLPEQQMLTEQEWGELVHGIRGDDKPKDTLNGIMIKL